MDSALVRYVEARNHLTTFASKNIRNDVEQWVERCNRCRALLKEVLSMLAEHPVTDQQLVRVYIADLAKSNAIHRREAELFATAMNGQDVSRKETELHLRLLTL